MSPRQDGGSGDEAHRHLHGRWLFDEQLSHDRLARRVAQGAQVKTTTLTEEFDFDAYREHYGANARLLFVVTPSRRLVVVTADHAPEPKPGDTLISLVDEPPAEPQADAQAEAQPDGSGPR